MDINLWDIEVKKYFNYIYDIDSLIQKIEEGSFPYEFKIKNKYTCGNKVTNNMEKIALESNINIIYTDDNHPACTNVLNEGYINKNFFKKHKEIIIKTVRKKILKEKYKIVIPDYAYSEDFVEKIINNSNKNINITFKNIQLSNKIIKKLLENHIEAKIETNGIQSQISTKYVIKNYTIDDLKNKKSIIISLDITDEEIANLKYCHNFMFISFKEFNKIDAEFINEEENLKKAKTIIEKINKTNKCFTIEILCGKRSNLEKSGLLELEINNIDLIITNDLYDYPFERYKKEEKQLNSMIDNIKNNSLSPFEKYIAIYNIVKNFKPYKENMQDKDKSRYLRYILNNNYMVCVGYERLLEVLLDKVGINAIEYPTEVDISYNDGFTLENKPLNSTGHSRMMLYMKDEKYGIDGYYIADPTWDNNEKKDEYTNLLMPIDYMQKSQNLFKLKSIDYIFDVHSIDEYKMKIHKLIEKKQNQYLSKNKINNEIDYYTNICNAYHDIFKTILKTIISLDPNKYNEIKNKINVKLNEYYNQTSFKNENQINKFKETIKYYESFFNEIGNYIVSKSNKEINNEIITKAIISTKLKTNSILPTNVEEYKESITEDIEKKDLEERPYKFPENYLDSSDDGVTIISRKTL